MPESIPAEQYHLLKVHEALRSYNEARGKLQRVWKGSRSSFSLDEVSTAWFDRVEAEETAADDDLVKSVAREVNKRRKQLEQSRHQTSLDEWESSTVRDLEHSTAENALNRASDALKEVRDELLA